MGFSKALWARNSTDWYRHEDCRSMPDNDTRWVHQVIWMLAVESRKPFVPKKITPGQLASDCSVSVEKLQECLFYLTKIGVIYYGTGYVIVPRKVVEHHSKLTWESAYPSPTPDPYDEFGPGWQWKGSDIKAVPEYRVWAGRTQLSEISCKTETLSESRITESTTPSRAQLSDDDSTEQSQLSRHDQGEFLGKEKEKEKEKERERENRIGGLGERVATLPDCSGTAARPGSPSSLADVGEFYPEDEEARKGSALPQVERSQEGQYEALAQGENVSEAKLDRLASSVVGLWNFVASQWDLPIMLDSHKKHVKKRLRDPEWRERWATAIYQTPRADWRIRGTKSMPSWRANPKWFLKPGTVNELYAESLMTETQMVDMPEPEDMIG